MNVNPSKPRAWRSEVVLDRNNAEAQLQELALNIGLPVSKICWQIEPGRDQRFGPYEILVAWPVPQKFS